MAFSKEVKIDALVSAARHCCVCHRYKGVKVEVHHIVPATEGGTDEAENAIALCFDCHADAGHYNAKHPKGTKFSPEELKQARDMWHFAVKVNRITVPDEVDRLYARYLVCKSYSAICEVSEGTLDNLPVESPFLFQNDIGEFQKFIVESHPDKYRHSHIWGGSHKSHEEYAKKYPNVRILDRTSKNLFPYFEALRQPSHDELRQNVATKDFVTSILLDAGVPAGDISCVFAYNEKCGDGGFQEIYRLRPLWSIFLAVSNISEQPVRIKSLLCETENPSGIGYRKFTEKIPSTEKVMTFPNIPILSKATVVIPITTVLGPIDGKSPDLFWQDMRDVSSGEVQTIGHGNGSNIVSETAIIGPSLWPKTINVECVGYEAEQQIHELDFSSLYTIDRFWECGSCPHLFFETQNGKRYWGELFAKTPQEIQMVEVQIPSDVYACIIAELEPEVTHILQISLNNNLLLSSKHVNQYEQINIPVKPGDCLCLTGYYQPFPHAEKLKPNPWRKNFMVSNYMRNAT